MTINEGNQMDLTRIFDGDVNDIVSFNAALRDLAVSETLRLPKGIKLYPKPLDDDDENSTLEITQISFYKQDSDVTADPEYAMIMDLELKPVAHFTSPAFVVLYRSRLYYVDAYALITSLVL